MTFDSQKPTMPVLAQIHAEGDKIQSEKLNSSTVTQDEDMSDSAESTAFSSAESTIENL